MHLKRIKNSCKSSVRRYTCDAASQLLGEYDSAGGALYETVYLDEQPVAVLKTAGTGYKAYYLYADHLNTPRLITDTAAGAANKKVWQWDSDPFGITPPNENPAAAGVFTYNPRFPGQVYDKETGLHYNYFRDYNPGTGRYVQSDPIGLAGGINTFGYVGGNPLSRIDPLGLLDSLHFDGTTLTGYDDGAVEFRVPAVSGPWGKGKLPDGVYDANSLRRRNDRAMTCRDGSGWSLNLDPMFKTKRDLLRIHPDGNVPGTEGCISPACSDQKQVYDSLKQFFDNNPGVKTIPLTVTYPK